jgi:hypothetical protein
MVLFQPDKLPVVLLIVPFVLLFAALYSTWNLGIVVKGRLYDKTETIRPRRRLGAAICASIVLLVVLQSLGQLTVRDVATLFAILVLGYFFLARNRVGKR